MKKTRKGLAILLSVLLALTVFAPFGTVSFAEGEADIIEQGDCGADGSDVQYKLYSDGTLVISGTGEIKAYAFGYEWWTQHNLHWPGKLIVEDGITAIGEGAFMSTFKSRSTAVLADSVKTVGRGAFENCDFASFDFGSVERLESHAFYNVGLPEINLPETLRYVGDQNFEATLLTNKRVIFGKNVEFIDNYTLFNSNVEEVVVRNANAQIGVVEGGYTFNCHSTCQKIYGYVGSEAEAYAIANDCTFVDLATHHEYDGGVYAIYPTGTLPGEIVFTCALCGQEKRIELPTAQSAVETGDCGAEGSDVHYTLYSDGLMVVEGTGVIKERGFKRNDSIKTLVIGEGIVDFESSAFAECINLETVVLPDSLERIGAWAFYSCRKLKSVSGGNHVKTIGAGAFAATGLESYRIPDSVETIEESIYLFDDSTAIEEVIFGRGIQELSDSGIQDYRHGTLKKVVFLNKDTVIPNGPFNKVFSTGEVPTIYSYAGGAVEAFANQNGHPFVDLNELHEGKDCEWDEGCISKFPTRGTLGEITYYCTLDPSHSKTETIPVINHVWGDWTIVQNSTDTEPGLAQRVCEVDPSHTESFAIPAYGPAIEIGDCGQDGDEVYYIVYEDGTLLITGTGAIRSDMFNSGNVSVSANVHNTNRLIIEDGVTAIGNSAFAFLHFNSIDFGNTLVSIGYDAFYDNDGFETVVLPDSVKTVGDCAFGLSSYLKTVVFGPNVETVGDWALGQCYNLENVVFLNKDTQIMEGEHQEHLGTVLHTVNSGTIYGYASGAVETYARTYGFRFIPLDDENWIRLPYGTDGLADGDWYFDDETFVDIIGRDKTQAEKDAVLESLHQHVTFYYYPNGGLFLIRYDYDKLPIEGVPVSGSAIYPFDFIVKPDAASVFDCEAMAESIAQYTAPTQPDNPQPDNPQPDQPQQEESSPRLIDRLLAPFKAFVSMVLSFFRKMFR